jgi:NAD(P)H-flavin reductase
MVEQMLHPMIPRTYLVDRVLKETSDTFTVQLLPENGTRDLPFHPGQFNMLYVYGVGEVPISISGDPADQKTLTHTTRAVGTVTKAMRLLKKGNMLGVRGPYGSHWPIENAGGHDVVILAGGIGMAPLRPALYELLANRDRYGKIILLYGIRTPADILFRKELERWRSRFDLEVFITVDRAIGTWRGNVGVVTTLIPKSPFDPLNTMAFICGPEIMMRYSIHELQKRGIANDHIFVSMERNMKCGIGACGHCQWGPTFVCKDGPVFPFAQVSDMIGKREL